MFLELVWVNGQDGPCEVFEGEYWMSEENSTQFQFRLGGIELEIAGDRQFVEQMYARVMRDIEAARKSLAEDAESRADTRLREKQILWVHRCSPMMHRICFSRSRVSA